MKYFLVLYVRWKLTWNKGINVLWLSLPVQIDKVSDEIDAAVEPVIKELEKELDQGTTSDNGVNAQKWSVAC